MSFEEKLWKHVDNKKLEHADSSTESMLEAIEKRKIEIEIKIAELAIEIQKKKISLNNPDEFGEIPNSAVINAIKLDAEKLISEKLLLEQKLRDVFEEEGAAEFTDDLAGGEPEKSISSEFGGKMSNGKDQSFLN